MNLVVHKKYEQFLHFQYHASETQAITRVNNQAQISQYPISMLKITGKNENL